MANLHTEQINQLYEAQHMNSVSITKKTRQWVRSGLLSYDVGNLAVSILDNNLVTINAGRMFIGNDLFEIDANSDEPYTLEITEELQDVPFRVIVRKTITNQQEVVFVTELQPSTATTPPTLDANEVSLARCYKVDELFVVEDERENCNGSLQVSVDNATRQIYINYGEAYVDGQLFQLIDNNDGLFSLPIPLDIGDKLFRVVIRKEADELGNITSVEPHIVTGTAEALPPVTRMDDCYEISLAHIRIENGSYVVIDERDNRAVCGLAEREIEGQHIIDLVYPIGSIYMGTNALNPGLMFGGTWQSWGNGRVAVGVDPAQVEFDVVEKEGGEKEHKITIDEMPVHNHTVRGAGRVYTLTGTSGTFRLGDDNGLQIGYVDPAYTSANGNGAPHNNLPPYITCYMFKRIA